jgi:hypothetical protein
MKLASLKNKALAVVAVFALLALAEWIAISMVYHKLTQATSQLELARGSQVSLLSLDRTTRQILSGSSPEKITQAISFTDLVDTQLKTLAEGGRLEGGNQSMGPVAELTAITVNELRQKWSEYKVSAMALATKSSLKDTPLGQMPETPTTDTVQIGGQDSRPFLTAEEAQAKMAINGKMEVLLTNYGLLLNDLRNDKRKAEILVKAVIGFCLVANILILVFVYRLFQTNVLAELDGFTQSVSTGVRAPNSRHQELARLSNSINGILDQLAHTLQFVQSIGDGKLDVRYGGADKAHRDALAQSLMSMQEKLKTMSEDEQRRKWANEGLTRFVNILRSGDDNIQKLGDKIVSELVEYTGSSQGALYVENDEDSNQVFLELISLYAFSHKKYEQQKLRIGESLVGQVYLEKEAIYLTEIPDDYIRISSGLGGANPKSILIVPLKLETQVYGIVELASLRLFQPHEITFVEKLGETLASSLASVKASQRNRKLLEESQKVTQTMKEKEEQMKQNMEELRATQEEMRRQENEYLMRIKELEAVEMQPKGADWATAYELEKQLRLHLEMIKIREGSKQTH